MCIVNIELGANGMCDPPDDSRHASLTRQYEHPGNFCAICTTTLRQHMPGITIS